jgi:hypothetical protein
MLPSENFLEPGLARAILNEMAALREAVADQSSAIRQLEVTVGQQTVILADRAASCPYRVDISRAGNNVVRLSDAEKAVQSLTVQSAASAQSIASLEEEVSDMKAHPKANVVVKDGPSINVDWKAVGGLLVVLGGLAGGICKALGVI